MTRRPRRRRLGRRLDDDPMSLLVNFFDCSIVFALAFMVQLFVRDHRPPAPAPGGTDAVEAARQIKVERFRPTQEQLTGQGERLGTAYRLSNGEVVYVPDRITNRGR